MIDVTLKFENPQTADSFVSWFQEEGADQFFEVEPTANTLDSEGRTFFLTMQETHFPHAHTEKSDTIDSSVAEVKSEDFVWVNGVEQNQSIVLGVGDSVQIKTDEAHGRNVSGEFRTFGSVEEVKQELEDITESNKKAVKAHKTKGSKK